MTEQEREEYNNRFVQGVGFAVASMLRGTGYVELLRLAGINSSQDAEQVGIDSADIAALDGWFPCQQDADEDGVTV